MVFRQELYVYLTYNDVHRFRNGSVHENVLPEILPNKQFSCSTRSHEITHETKTITGLKPNYVTCNSEVVEREAIAIIPIEDNLLNRSDRLLRFRC